MRRSERLSDVTFLYCTVLYGYIIERKKNTTVKQETLFFFFFY
jgi:hypothetical protein